jgi:hypothetical protein
VHGSFESSAAEGIGASAGAAGAGLLKSVWVKYTKFRSVSTPNNKQTTRIRFIIENLFFYRNFSGTLWGLSAMIWVPHNPPTNLALQERTAIIRTTLIGGRKTLAEAMETTRTTLIEDRKTTRGHEQPRTLSTLYHDQEKSHDSLRKDQAGIASPIPLGFLTMLNEKPQFSCESPQFYLRLDEHSAFI